MATLRILSISKSGNRLKLPLLFCISVTFFSLVLPSSSSYATDGYLTRDRSKFDGFICGTADATSNIGACNAYVSGHKRNAQYNYMGYYGNYPYVNWPKNGDPKTQPFYSNAQMGGKNALAFYPTMVGSGSVTSNGYDYQAAVNYHLQNTFSIPDSWFGNKVVVSWDFDIGSYVSSSATAPSKEENGGVVLNWGAVTVEQLTLDACSNVDIPFAFVNTDVMNNDFISFSFDFTNITKDQCSAWDWYLTATPSNVSSTYGNRYLLANFTKDYYLYYMSPYIAYDIIPPEESDGLEGIVDDWKSQQEQEFEYERDYIDDNGTTAQTSGNAILSAFNFTIVDPLLGIFALFSDNTCVNIPIIGNMIHVTNTQVCSPWSAQVRQVLTPVFTIGGTLLLWGFVMSWLRNDSAMVEVSEYTTSFRSKK